jgi:hypothetical protein
MPDPSEHQANHRLDDDSSSPHVSEVETVDPATALIAPTPSEVVEEHPERRSTPRRKKLRHVVVTDPTDTVDAMLAWVVDRSLGGMRLLMDHPVEVGAVFHVRDLSAAPNIPSVEVRVQSVTHGEDGWELGCEFTRSPSYEALLQFG